MALLIISHISKQRIIPEIKKDHFKVTKESIHQEDVKIPNIYAPNNRSAKYIKQKQLELQGQIEKSTIIFGDFSNLTERMSM